MFWSPISNPQGGERKPSNIFRKGLLSSAQGGRGGLSNRVRRRPPQIKLKTTILAGGLQKPVQHLCHPPSLVWKLRVLAQTVEPPSRISELPAS